MLLTNYKHTQPTLGLSVPFVFNIEYIHNISLQTSNGLSDLRFVLQTKLVILCIMCLFNM